MRLISLLCVAALATCSSPDPQPEPEPQADEPPEEAAADEPQAAERSAPAGDPAWRAIAEPGRLAGADEALARLEPPRRAAVEGLLDRAGALGTGPEALERAATLLRENASVGNDPAWAGSGCAPGSHAVHVAGLALLAGMAGASARADASDAVALSRVACRMPMTSHANSGGPTSTAEDRNAIVDAVARVTGDDGPRLPREDACADGVGAL